jgi:autotransporter-associated beta strand protein
MTLSGDIANNSEVLYEAATGSALFLDGAVSGAGTWTVNSASSNTAFDNRMIFRGTSTVSGQVTVTNYGNLWLEGSSVNATSAIYLNGANTYLRVYGAVGATIKSGIITGNGTIDFASGGGGKALTLSVGNDNGSGSFTGTIVNSASSDGPTVLSIAKEGSGTWTLSGANTYKGGTTITAGTVKIGHATALGASTGAVTLSSGAVLDLNGITMTNTNALSLSGTGISAGGSLINSSSTASTYAGAVTMGSATIMNTASGITLTGALTGGSTTNTLLLKGGGNFTLNNASNVISTFAGQVGSLTLRSDNLLIGTASAVSGLSATGNITINVTGDIIANSAVAYSGSTSGTLSFTAGDDIFINSTIATSDGALGVQLTAGALTGYIGIENNITTRGGAVAMTASTIALQQNAFTINTTALSGTGGAVTFTGPVLIVNAF